MIVSIEQDAKYRRDGDRFVEVCRSCGVDRTADTCACGAKFERLKRSFFAASWEPTTVTPRVPALCPHCDAKPTHVRSITMVLPTSRSGRKRMTIEIPSCKKMLPPFAAYLLFITTLFFVVVFGLAATFGQPLVWIAVALALAAAFAAWRAYGWVRFASFDHRSIRIRARRRDYAMALAERNDGRIV